MTDEESPPLLSLAQAADRLGVTRWTVRRWIDSGYLRAVQVSARKTRVPAPEVERVLRGEQS